MEGIVFMKLEGPHSARQSFESRVLLQFAVILIAYLFALAIWHIKPSRFCEMSRSFRSV